MEIEEEREKREKRERSRRQWQSCRCIDSAHQRPNISGTIRGELRGGVAGSGDREAACMVGRGLRAKSQRFRGVRGGGRGGEGGTVHFHVLLSVCLLHVVITTGRLAAPFSAKVRLLLPSLGKI